MNIIEQNLIALISSGAFDEQTDILPMSQYKWRYIADIANNHQLTSYIMKGIEKNRHNKLMNIPDNVIKILSEERNSSKAQTELYNSFLDNRHQRIKETERHAIDTSVETLSLLNMIVESSKQLLANYMSISSIVEIGQFMRSKGDRVDYVKLEKWLQQTHLHRIAALTGSVLIGVFGFAQDEIPFVNRYNYKAEKIALKTIKRKILPEEWHFKQSNSGFVVNNSKQFRRNMRRSLYFFTYSPILSICTFTNTFIRSLKEIEE